MLPFKKDNFSLYEKMENDGNGACNIFSFVFTSRYEGKKALCPGFEPWTRSVPIERSAYKTTRPASQSCQVANNWSLYVLVLSISCGPYDNTTGFLQTWITIGDRKTAINVCS